MPGSVPCLARWHPGRSHLTPGLWGCQSLALGLLDWGEIPRGEGATAGGAGTEWGLARAGMRGTQWGWGCPSKAPVCGCRRVQSGKIFCGNVLFWWGVGPHHPSLPQGSRAPQGPEAHQDTPGTWGTCSPRAKPPSLAVPAVLRHLKATAGSAISTGALLALAATMRVPVMLAVP